MARKRKSSRSSSRRSIGDWAGALSGAVRARGTGTLHVFGALICVGALMFGLGALRKHVSSLPEYDLPIDVQLVDAPAWLDAARVDEMLSDLPPMRFLDEDATRVVAEHVGSSGWVARVVRAERCAGGVIEVQCDYRRPLAVVQHQGRFVLIDDLGVRLPGMYSDPGEFLILQGVAESPPRVGELWDATDLQAGLRLARLILREPFVGQVGAISVHNYRGREVASEAHLALLTRPDGSGGGWGRVLWGSGPGEEIEEPTATEKIRVLRANYQQCGRIDAGAAWIDVSISPGEYRRPTGGHSA
jgi:hypothetical protein